MYIHTSTSPYLVALLFNACDHVTLDFEVVEIYCLTLIPLHIRLIKL